MKAKVRLYLTANGKALVDEGDPKGASLYAAPGDEIPESAVELFGLVDGGLKGAKAKSGDAGAAKPKTAAGKAKEAAPGEDKEAAPGEDKTESGAAKAEASGDEATSPGSGQA